METIANKRTGFPAHSDLKIRVYILVMQTKEKKGIFFYVKKDLPIECFGFWVMQVRNLRTINNGVITRSLKVLKE